LGMAGAWTPELNNPYYLTHLTQAAESHEVRATADIHSQSGMKLIAKGTRIDSRHLERLVAHKLSHPIDGLVSVADPVRAEDLAARARQLAMEDPFTRLVSPGRTSERAVDVLGRINCLPVLAGKLAILKERLPGQLDHAIRISLCVAVIAERLGHAAQDCVDAATAGIAHDIGNLHIDPAIFRTQEALTAEQQRQVKAHPVIGHMILRQFSLYTPLVSDAVLQHHERLDGSGYPKGMRGGEIGVLGKALAAAEVAVSVLERAPELDISVFLRSHGGMLDREALAGLISETNVADPGQRRRRRVEPQAVSDRIRLLNRAVMGWDAPADAEQTKAERYVNQRLQLISRNLVRAGVGPNDPSERLAELAGEPELLSELDVLSQEALFQLRATLQEVRQRWPGYAEEEEDVFSAWLDDMGESFGRLG
jgi:HD-GYP domain-containing protein (c-di-GMP phosphodiesterase class II)